VSEIIDNRAHRVRTLKSIIERLHHGEAPAAVKPLVASLVQECDARDIAAMEQELMADGMPVIEIMHMCDLHAEVLRDVVVERPHALPPGHPVDTFKRENEALREACGKLRALGALALTGIPDDAVVEPKRHRAFHQAFNELMDVEKHYLRKEHLLFPFLERAGITGPSKVMWGKDDEVRARLKDAAEALGAEQVTAAEWRLLVQLLVAPAIAAIEEMILKEEKVLLPMALDTLAEDDWAEIWRQSPQIGWCLVEPREGWTPPEPEIGVSEAALAAAASAGVAYEADAHAAFGAALTGGTFVLPSGAVSLEQLKAIFSILPVDLTFVDADDRVRFFTEGRARVFHRAKAVIGRKVQHCHPPASVSVVERILSDFREGRQDVAEFWIDFRGRFVQIRYFAVRNPGGAYLGTLEVTQDLTRERALEGERRLLEYE
jgi:DUF438 domain-containing protein